MDRPDIPDADLEPIPATYACPEPSCPEYQVAKTSDVTFAELPRCGHCFADCEQVS